MAIPISPGVYSKIIDLSSYVAAVPGTIGFMIIISDKGSEKVSFIADKATLFNTYGEVDFQKYGRYAHALITIENFLDAVGSFYVLRVAADDAAYSNIYVAIDSTVPTKPVVVMDSKASLNSQAEIDTFMADGPSSTVKVCHMFYGKDRGAYYNDIYVKVTESANLDDVYVLDVYQTQSDGDLVIIESRLFSYDMTILDDSGDTRYGPDVLERFSSYARMAINDENYAELLTITSGDDVINLATEPDAIVASGDRYLVDVAAEGSFVGQDGKIAEYDGSAWVFTTPDRGEVYKKMAPEADGSYIKWIFDGDTWEVFNPGTALFSPESLTDRSYKKYAEGSDGSLIVNNRVVPAVADQLLVSGYLGMQDPDVIDTDMLYYTLVIDPGYSDDVKVAEVNLTSVIRRDCILITDNGDNVSVDTEISKKVSDHGYNTFYASIYCNYSKVYDYHSGANIWVSPVYHMAKIIPLTHVTADIWAAPAGFNRAMIPAIKELRYNPKLGQRDQLYLNQLNPIVQFREGYVVWGQLTSQARPSAMQDLNVAITVLYIKRALEQYCKFYIFEYNNATTWSSITRDINEFLNDLQKRGALRGYSVEVGATEYEIKTKTCHVNIILQPTRVIEKIDLNLFIK